MRAKQCTATEVAVDMPGAERCRCQREPGHEPPHHCQHGFHWTKGGNFTGTCGHCRTGVVVKVG